MIIAIQGDRGSFHEVAANRYFNGISLQFISCSTFDVTIESVRKHKADLALIAIENARSGSILYNYSLIRESGLKVLGECNLRIRQNLMALPGQSIDHIREIWTHPIALAQCMDFLNKYPKISLIESADTAGSARKISENQITGVASIGADIAASIYNLEILAQGIETYQRNYTRFLVVGKDNGDWNGADKASVCFSLGHRPGSLASLLMLLADMNINLSKIQSVPKINGGWEYLFYLDLEFDETVNVNDLVSVLEKNSNDLEILGIYKKGNKLYESTNS
ncbi:MAG: prephenate dehydratase [Bacteroidales bacterium]|nr:prephenate dehydratase [Bacteroidales bacterium]